MYLLCVCNCTRHFSAFHAIHFPALKAIHFPALQANPGPVKTYPKDLLGPPCWNHTTTGPSLKTKGKLRKTWPPLVDACPFMGIFQPCFAATKGTLKQSRLHPFRQVSQERIDACISLGWLLYSCYRESNNCWLSHALCSVIKDGDERWHPKRHPLGNPHVSPVLNSFPRAALHEHGLSRHVDLVA